MRSGDLNHARNSTRQAANPEFLFISLLKPNLAPDYTLQQYSVKNITYSRLSRGAPIPTTVYAG